MGGRVLAPGYCDDHTPSGNYEPNEEQSQENVSQTPCPLTPTGISIRVHEVFYGESEVLSVGERARGGHDCEVVGARGVRPAVEAAGPEPASHAARSTDRSSGAKINADTQKRREHRPLRRLGPAKITARHMVRSVPGPFHRIA